MINYNSNEVIGLVVYSNGCAVHDYGYGNRVCSCRFDYVRAGDDGTTPLSLIRKVSREKVKNGNTFSVVWAETQEQFIERAQAFLCNR